MNENIQQYAGFWRRFAGYAIDSAVITFVMSQYVIFSSWYLTDDTLRGSGFFHLYSNIVKYINSILFTWLYFSGMESSPLQATFGKWILGLYVTDLLKFGQYENRSC